jgi:hypothetical protein
LPGRHDLSGTAAGTDAETAFTASGIAGIATIPIEDDQIDVLFGHPFDCIMEILKV